MNFDEAMQAHTSWKIKLRTYLSKPDGSLKPADFEPDNRCALGKWIHGEGAKHAALAEFQSLKDAHVGFHKAAANVVRQADSGKSVSEDLAIGSSSEFATKSSAMIRALLMMKMKAA
jgi:hypothetical protein